MPFPSHPPPQIPSTPVFLEARDDSRQKIRAIYLLTKALTSELDTYIKVLEALNLEPDTYLQVIKTSKMELETYLKGLGASMLELDTYSKIIEA